MEAFGGLAGIGVLFGGLGFAYAQFRAGAGKAKDELIETLKETALAEKEKAAQLAKDKMEQVQFHQTQINELNGKIGKLQGLYEASEKSKQEYLLILQGRDPAQQKFMELLTNAALESKKTTGTAEKYMADTIAILGEIRTFMENLNKQTTANKRTLDEIVSDTAHKEGDPLRKKA
jgi:hypothetical protein